MCCCGEKPEFPEKTHLSDTQTIHKPHKLQTISLIDAGDRTRVAVVGARALAYAPGGGNEDKFLVVAFVDISDHTND